VVIAYLAQLVSECQYEQARELLDRFPERGQFSFDALVAYLRYVLREVTDLSGVTAYQSLTADDLFLGACYYEGDAAAALQQQSQWDYPSLERSLRAADGGTKYLNDFKVRGLRPRIAELAFREIVGRLPGADAARRLRDLNAERVASVRPPRTLASRPPLPSADWADGDGQRYDVKCNLFYRSEQAKKGLRGFLIELKQASDPDCSYPGFVFTETTDESCRWVYVGEYRPGIAAKGHAKARVLPFYCRLPDEVRFVLPGRKGDLDAGMQLLSDRFLRLGWKLAVGQRAVPRREASTTAESFLEEVVERCGRGGAGTCLEHAIWMALTDAALDACSRWDSAAVDAPLKLAEEFIASRAFPVRLPRIDGKPILSRWIEHVLKPLAEHWSLIRCPTCGAVQLVPERSGSASGT
jgi:hypothetical protein